MAVQLIVFFAAIREILKKEIYAADKQCFSAVKTKAQFLAIEIRMVRIADLTDLLS